MDIRTDEEKYSDTSMVAMQITGASLDLQSVLMAGVESVRQTRNKWYEIKKADDGSLIFVVYTKNNPDNLDGVEGMII